MSLSSCFAVTALVCGGFALLVNAANPLVADLKVDAITKNGAAVTWTMIRQNVFLDTGLTYTVTLGKQGDAKCKYFETFDEKFTLIGMVKCAIDKQLTWLFLFSCPIQVGFQVKLVKQYCLDFYSSVT